MMASKFEFLSVEDALERSLKNAKWLSARDSALVATARVLAKRIDAIAGGGFIDSNGKLDNVTVPTFLKYLQALGLTVEVDARNVSKPRSNQVDMLTAFRQKHEIAG